MKKQLSISFLLLYLLTTFNCFELLKLPILIEHYKEHKNLNKDIDFIDFMSIHYFSRTIIDDDYEKDTKLPFKSNDTFNNCNISNVYIFQYNKIDIQELFYEINLTTYFVITDDFAVSQNHNSIWQPPKFC